MDAEYWSEGPLCRLNFGRSGYCFRCLLHGKAWMFGSWVLRIDLMGSHQSEVKHLEAWHIQTYRANRKKVNEEDALWTC